MRKGLTDISIVLDRSGSMSSIADDTRGGFNKFILDQRTTPGEAVVTLVQFDHEYQCVHNGVNIADVPELTSATYVPRGNTALLDAIGRTINDTGARIAALTEEDRPEFVVFVIITDGHENASREFARDKVMEMITHQREVYSWSFIFLGADADAIDVARSYGISRDTAMQYSNTSAGVNAVFDSTSRNLRSMRTIGDSATLNYSDKDRAEQEALLKKSNA